MKRPSPFLRRGTEVDMDSAMTPMIDVVFLLLVFFVWTASFVAVEQVLPVSFLRNWGTKNRTRLLRLRNRIWTKSWCGSRGRTLNLRGPSMTRRMLIWNRSIDSCNGWLVLRRRLRSFCTRNRACRWAM